MIDFSKEEVSEAWNACQYGEQYLIDFIKKYLRTPEHKQKLFDADLEISEVLNGRYTQQHETLVDGIFHDWNISMGRKEFGF